MAFRNSTDMAFLLVDALDTILTMTGMVYSCIELAFEEAEKAGNETPSQDTLNVIFTAVDNGFIQLVSGLLAINWTAKEAKIELSSLGELTIEAASMNDITGIETKDAQSPTLFAEQAQLVMQTSRLIPDAFDFIKNLAVSPKAMADQANEEPEKEGI